MLVPPPGRLSTNTLAPSDSESFCATVRPTKSVPPPGTYGTTRRTARDGYVCATTLVAANPAMANAAPACVSQEHFNAGPASFPLPQKFSARGESHRASPESPHRRRIAAALREFLLSCSHYCARRGYGFAIHGCISTR